MDRIFAPMNYTIIASLIIKVTRGAYLRSIGALVPL